MPKRSASGSDSPPSKRKKPSAAPAQSDPLSIDYKSDPTAYRILRGEMNVFKTNPYSAELKLLWRFKDEAAARKSSEAVWKRFEGYRAEDDFVGMDITRKFLQMGYTRSTRYALRPAGRKYSASTGLEIPRTGEIADEEKYRGAKVFKEVWKRLEADPKYEQEKERWRVEVEGKKPTATNKEVKVEVEEKIEQGKVASKPSRAAADRLSRKHEEETPVRKQRPETEPEPEPLRSIKQEPVESEEEEKEDIKPASRRKATRSSAAVSPPRAKKGTAGKGRGTRSEGPIKSEPNE